MPRVVVRVTPEELVALQTRASEEDRSMQRYLHRLLFSSQGQRNLNELSKIYGGQEVFDHPGAPGPRPDLGPAIERARTIRETAGAIQGSFSGPPVLIEPDRSFATFRPAPKPGKR